MRNDLQIIDFHSHILPHVDHGSDSLATSLKQLKLMASHGVDVAVATSHFYPNEHRIDSFLKRRDESAERLLGAADSDAPKIVLGAEVLICDGLENMKGIERLCIGNTNYLMLEMPMGRWNISLFDTISNIKKLGIIPIMAHIDRFLKLDVDSLIDLGVYVQVNADAVLSPVKRKRILRMIEDDLVVALGSDLHQYDKGTYKKFVKALTKLGPDTEKIMKKSQEIFGCN